MRLKLNNHNALGDVVCMTCAIRDLAASRYCESCHLDHNSPSLAIEANMDCPICGKPTFRRKYQVTVETTYPLIWLNNPYLEDNGEYDMILNIGPKAGVQHSNHSGVHLCEAYRMSIEEKTYGRIAIQQGELIPDLHLSEWEKANSLIAGRYWLICIGIRPQFTSKLWPYERWQDVVSSLPNITFVQIGSSEHYHPQLEGDNVINYVGKTEDPETGVRDLLRLFYHCDGSAGLISMHAHIAAAFKKPAVVVAGAREPMRFEAYPFHRYLHNQGAMSCVGLSSDGKHRDHQSVYSCWKTSIDACPNRDGEYAKCLTMIDSSDVVKGIMSYYIGGMLSPIEHKASISLAPSKVFKMVCNAEGYGGGERSSIWIMNRMLEEGYRVQLVPSGGIGEKFRQAMSPYIEVINHLTRKADILMLYANDMVFKLGSEYQLLKDVHADRKIMVLNYRLGDVGKLNWTTIWDKYIFLCSDLRDGFLLRSPDRATCILPPPVDLSKFLNLERGSLNKTLHIVRVSSQGDSKYPPNIGELIEDIRRTDPAVRFSFMPCPGFLFKTDGVSCFASNTKPVIDILQQGTVFWYILPDGYLDNGPRVIMEAMATGLPIVADARGGAKDRVTEETGWLCQSQDEHIDVISNLTGKDVSAKGQAARERAKVEFDPEKWVTTIVDDKEINNETNR